MRGLDLDLPGKKFRSFRHTQQAQGRLSTGPVICALRVIDIKASAVVQNRHPTGPSFVIAFAPWPLLTKMVRLAKRGL